MTINFKQVNNIDGTSIVTLNSRTSFVAIDNIGANSGDFTDIQFSTMSGGYAQMANISSQDIRTDTLEALDITTNYATVKTLDVDTINSNTINNTGTITTYDLQVEHELKVGFNEGKPGTTEIYGPFEVLVGPASFGVSKASFSTPIFSVSAPAFSINSLESLAPGLVSIYAGTTATLSAPELNIGLKALPLLGSVTDIMSIASTTIIGLVSDVISMTATTDINLYGSEITLDAADVSITGVVTAEKLISTSTIEFGGIIFRSDGAGEYVWPNPPLLVPLTPGGETIGPMLSCVGTIQLKWSFARLTHLAGGEIPRHLTITEGILSWVPPRVIVTPGEHIIGPFLTCESETGLLRWVRNSFLIVDPFAESNRRDEKIFDKEGNILIEGKAYKVPLFNEENAV